MGKEVQQQIALNLLSEGTQITGDLHASNDIRIDGELKGKIFTKGRLVIGQMAKVEGEVNSPNVDILGTMEGNIVSTQKRYSRERLKLLISQSSPERFLMASAISNEKFNKNN